MRQAERETGRQLTRQRERQVGSETGRERETGRQLTRQRERQAGN